MALDTRAMKLIERAVEPSGILAFDGLCHVGQRFIQERLGRLRALGATFQREPQCKIDLLRLIPCVIPISLFARDQKFAVAVADFGHSLIQSAQVPLDL